MAIRALCPKISAFNELRFKRQLSTCGCTLGGVVESQVHGTVNMQNVLLFRVRAQVEAFNKREFKIYLYYIQKA